ncbi:glutathione S-transferase family protein [Salinisphaera aquimarina]|uniref:Glutathione S-transferase family protein n=1 Tax=Salinisphaera aquimarina TaxID=2094031 RepID=A0ABV7EKV2_9GAMM
MSYRLHIANKNYSSWSMRAWVLMKALGIPFKEVLTPFDGAGRQTAFDTFSPTGKVPCLEHGELTIWDSLAIAEYLAESYSHAWPANGPARAWARSATAEMHSGFPALRDECSMNCSLTIDLGTPSDALQADLDRLDQLWTDGLSRFHGPWLGGSDFTTVDAFYAPVAVRIRGYQLTLGEPAMAYPERLWHHPSISQWVHEGIEETWVDKPHEEDCVRGRKILTNRRQS